MCAVRQTPIAICCSDLHLTLSPPLARSDELNWLKAQARPLRQLKALADQLGVEILCAGDVFDRWNSPPELINWAIDHLPSMYAIPGQHDLPTHVYSLLNKSAYWTLAMGGPGRLSDLGAKESCIVGNMSVEAFPWGVDLTPPKVRDSKRLKVALVHEYVWTVGATYPGAPKESRVGQSLKNIEGWDVIIYGDNHKGFLTRYKNTTVFNCGTLQRRKSDEIAYKPQVGILYSDGSIEPHLLDVSSDIIKETSPMLDRTEDMELGEFLQELTKLQDAHLDFEEAMNRLLRERKPGPLVQTLIKHAMSEKEKM